MNISVLSLQQRISAISIVVVFLSAFFPWVSVFNYMRLGVQEEGLITLFIALAGAAVFMLGSDFLFPRKMSPKAADIALVVLAGTTVLLALVSTVSYGSFASIGVYFTLLAGIGWAVGAVWHLVVMLGATKAQQAWQSPQGPVPPNPTPTEPQADVPAPAGPDVAVPNEYPQHTAAPPAQSPPAQNEQHHTNPDQDEPTSAAGDAPGQPGAYQPPKSPGQKPREQE